MRIELRTPELNDAALVQNSALGAFFYGYFVGIINNTRRSLQLLLSVFLFYRLFYIKLLLH